MAGRGKRVEAIGYMRTSSATNVGDAKDIEVRQQKAIESFAKSAGYIIVDWFYDAARRAPLWLGPLALGDTLIRKGKRARPVRRLPVV